MLFTLLETSLKSTGAGSSKVLEVSQAGQKADLPEQGSSSRTQAEKESVRTLEARMISTEG